MRKRPVELTSNTTRLWAVGILIAAGVVTASASALPAFAAGISGGNQPTIIDAAQGTTATPHWTYHIPAGSLIQPGTGLVAFNAPAGTVFVPQPAVPYSRSDDGSTFSTPSVDGPLHVTDCTTANGGQQLNCTTIHTVLHPFPSGEYLRYLPQVEVGDTAPLGEHSALASFHFGGGMDPLIIHDGTLDIRITEASSTSMITHLAGFALLMLTAAGLGIFLVRRSKNRTATNSG